MRGLLLVLLLAGCVLSEQQAKDSAVAFAADHSRFFVRENQSISVVSNVTFSAVSAYRNGDSWVVIINVESGGRSASVEVIVGNDGKVKRFNNRPV